MEYGGSQSSRFFSVGGTRGPGAAGGRVAFEETTGAVEGAALPAAFGADGASKASAGTIEGEAEGRAEAGSLGADPAGEPSPAKRFTPCHRTMPVAPATTPTTVATATSAHRPSGAAADRGSDAPR